MRRLAISTTKCPRDLVPITPANYDGEQLYTVQEVAGILRVSVQTVRSWLYRRKMTHLRFKRRIRVSQSEIDRFVEEMTNPRVIERSDDTAPQSQQGRPLKDVSSGAVVP